MLECHVVNSNFYFYYGVVLDASPLTCEGLLHPLSQPHLSSLGGTWALVAGSLSSLPLLERFRQRDSASVNFSSSASETRTSYTSSIRLNNTCLYNSYNISMEGRSFTYDGTAKSNLTANFVYTSCRDCILMRMYVESGQRQHLYLFSRRRQLEQEEMEEFRAQVKVNMEGLVCIHQELDFYWIFQSSNLFYCSIRNNSKSNCCDSHCN
uniref:Apolipoprotein M n=1 Tax=Nothobranchius furzeri TaxID=105023 RepID=A0A8C6LVY7_NOTFU